MSPSTDPEDSIEKPLTDSSKESVPAVSSPSAAAPLAKNLGLLLDVEVEASLRFGEREMRLGEVLELHAGSVVELNRQLQEPVELLVAGRVIARGDVVVVDGNYGLRITDIVQGSWVPESPQP
jgi:flagellar motor switch protein FliN/FliY